MFPPAGPESGTGGSALRLTQRLLAGRCRRSTQACFLPHVPANLPCVNRKKLDLGASSLSVIMASHPKGGREKPFCKYQNFFISHSVFSRQCLWPSVLNQLVVCRKRSRVMRGDDFRGRAGVRIWHLPGCQPAVGPIPVSWSLWTSLSSSVEGDSKSLCKSMNIHK